LQKINEERWKKRLRVRIEREKKEGDCTIEKKGES
jgi:hypothetical protein